MAEVSPNGLIGDRAWACVDNGPASDPALVGSAKQPRMWGGMLDVDTRTDEDGVHISIGDLSAIVGSPAADKALSSHLGRPVRLINEVPADAKLRRLMPAQSGLVPSWMANTAPGEELTTGFAASRTEAGARFHDFGAVHIVTTGELSRLAERLDRASVPPSRFRPNLLLELDSDPAPGTRITWGETVLSVQVPTPRCIVPSIPGGGAPLDKQLSATLAHHYRTEIGDYGKAARFGFYAEVLQPGPVHQGQAVELEQPDERRV